MCIGIICPFFFKDVLTGPDEEPAGENPDEIQVCEDNDDDPSECINMSNASSFRSQKAYDPPSDM